MFSNIKSHHSLYGSLHANHAKKESDSPENTLKGLLLKETDQDGKNSDQKNKKKKEQEHSSSYSVELSDESKKAQLENEKPKKDFLKLLNII